MKKLLPFLLLCCSLYACHSPEKNFLSTYLNTGNLPQQTFTINSEKDTTITSSGGVQIHISQGTFSTDKPVTIEWKEALDFQSILKAGLTTQSGKAILRSGGMFYFNTTEKLAIQKPIGIDVPTETIASGMQLYKGDSSEGKLDWKEPKPIENIRAFGENALGKTLFEGNCASCHKIGQDLTGPALAGITKRRSKQWLYAVIHNTAAMAKVDPVICCEIRKYGVVMQAFPGLSNAEMDSIYDHIDFVTESLGIESKSSCDSCVITDQAYDSLLTIYTQQYSSNFLPRDSIQFTKPDMPLEQEADIRDGKQYYQVAIQSEGWYNIDALFKDWTGAIPSNLIVHPQSEMNIGLEYYLAIPAMKILVGGMTQNKGETVVFDEANGQIPLPQQRGAFIIAVGGADGSYFFTKKDFIIATNQVINLPIQKVTKQQFEAQMKELAYYGLNAEVEDAKNAPVTTRGFDSTMITVEYKAPLQGIEMQLQKLAAKKKKDCGCIPSPVTDGTGVDTQQH